MMLSDIQQIVEAAERACTAAINHSKSTDLREHLFDALEPVVDPAFVEEDSTQSTHLLGLLRRASVCADIVRSRIDKLRNSKVATSAASIQYPARDLQRLLSQFLGELREQLDSRP